MRRKVQCTIRSVMYRSSGSRGKKKEAEEAEKCTLEKKYRESSHKAGKLSGSKRWSVS